MKNKTILVTGGAGFIGSAVVRYIINNTNNRVINVDKLTYAGNLENLTSIEKSKNYTFEKVDICDKKEIERIYNQYQPNTIMHLAAESHVDRSIDAPSDFIQTNIIGTYVLLEQTRKYINETNKNIKFHHISTDEVYGDLENTKDLFTEETPYNPSSPYSASKASSDHLIRAWGRTFNIPIVITNCSNNYGYFHFPEKLIPLIILNALKGEKLPIYGDGSQIRDWLFVEDHAEALFLVATKGKIGETYNIGGHNEKKNIDVVKIICEKLDILAEENKNKLGINKYSDLIEFVEDRAGHDIRYAIDASKIKKELGWVPKETFESGIEKTIKWYLENLNKYIKQV